MALWNDLRNYIPAVETDTRTHYREFGILGFVCLCVVGIRSYYVSNVFRGEDVVHMQVDPWKYQVHLERLTGRTTGPLDLSLFVDPGSVVGGGREAGLTPTGQDDLMVATLGWIAELLGGTPHAVGTVLAVYPVVVAVLLCLLAYAAARWLTDEPWAGLATAGVVAITPANIYRTALGFGDHHAFDYLWLAVTIAAVAYLSREEETSRYRWIGAIVVLGLALAAQTLSWEGSPLLLVPYAGFVLLVVFSTLRTEQSLLSEVGPYVVGLAIAAEVVTVAVVYLAWQTPTAIALLIAQIVALGGLLLIGELGHRYVPWAAVTGSALLAAIISASVVAYRRVPEIPELLELGVAYFATTTGTVAEATSLIGGGDPARTVLAFFGLLALVFVPGLVWCSWRVLRTHRPGLLAVVAYAWYFLALSLIQRRFAGELSLFFAIVVGTTLVAAVRRVPWVLDAAERRLGRAADGNTSLRDGDRLAALTADLRVVFSLTLVGAFLVSVTVAQVPLTMEHRIVSDGEYEAAQRMEAHAAETDVTRTQVFSPINTNLMYNYYAHDGAIWNNKVKSNYDAFVLSSNDRGWYRRLAGDGTGFVVVSDAYDVRDPTALHTRLQDDLGSARGEVDGVSQFRLLYRSADDSTTVYTLVPGARLTGTATPNERVAVSTTVDTPERTFVYERYPRAAANGTFSVVVPYPGTYRIGNRTGEVSEQAVETGATVRL